jgi:hypothetical protein
LCKRCKRYIVMSSGAGFIEGSRWQVQLSVFGF